MRNYPRGPVYVEHTDGSIGFLDDVTDWLKDVTKGATDEASKVVQDQTSDALEKLLRSSEFGVVIQRVEDAAREAVIEEASKNALNLFILAVSGGAIGGMVFKGKVGAVAAGLLTVFAATRMIGSPAKTASAASDKLSTKKAR